MSSKAILRIVISGALVVRLLHFWFISQTAFPKLTFRLTEFDMYATWQWAQTIIAGDILGKNTYHPYSSWVKDIAPVETWYRWWGGKEIFQQTPLYPYFVAALAAVSNSSINFILLVQLTIGAAHPLIIFFLGRRLFGETAGLIAAALTAFYGPFIFYQGTLLRDWLPPILEPAALLLLLKAKDRGAWADWILAGAVIGVAILTRESAVLLLPIALLWLLWELDWNVSRLVKSGAAVLIGVFVAVSPLIARNLIVGAPPLALSNRTAETLIEGNAAVTEEFVDVRYIKRIMERSGGRISSVVREVIESYHGDFTAALDKYGTKLRAILGPVDIPDNLNYYYGREISPPLAFGTVSFSFIFPFGVLGFILSRRSWLLMLYGLTVLATLLILPAFGRYRLTLAPVVILYAAAGAVWLTEAWQRNGPRWFLACIAAAAAIGILQYIMTPSLPLNVSRLHGGIEYTTSTSVYRDEKRFDRAAAELQKLESVARDYPGGESLVPVARLRQRAIYMDWAKWLQDNGHDEEARLRRRQAQAIVVASDKGKDEDEDENESTE